MIDLSETTPSRRGRRKRSRNGKGTGLRCWSTYLAVELESHFVTDERGCLSFAFGLFGGCQSSLFVNPNGKYFFDFTVSVRGRPLLY